MKIKNQPVKVKAGPDDGLAEGQFQAYASVFGNKDSYGDVVVKGAFADDLKAWEESGSPIPLLFGHNMSDPDYNIGHVVKAIEDDHGLLVTAELDLENPKAVQTYRLLKGRRINQMSFAYDVVEGADAKSDDLGDYYELRRLKTYEVSVVPIGANQETEVLAVKAAVEGLAAVKAGRVLSTKNEKALRDARDAIDSVLSALDSTAQDQEKASDAGPAKSDEEPGRAKSDEEPNQAASVDELLAATIQIKKLGARS